jgi:hypothetical protein
LETAVTTKLIETLKAGGWLKEKNAIGGTWRDAYNGDRHDVTDPATSAVIGTIPWSGTCGTQSAAFSWHVIENPADKLKRLFRSNFLAG